MTQYAAPIDGPDEVDDLGFVFSDVLTLRLVIVKRLNAADSYRFVMVPTKNQTETFLLAHRGNPQLEVGWVPACKEVKKKKKSGGNNENPAGGAKFPALVTKTKA